MKSIFFISALFISYGTLAQTLDEPLLNNRIGIKAGLNYSILSASINNDIQWKPGLAAGLYYQGKLKNNVSIQMEILFSMQGCKNKYIGPGNQTIGESDLNLNYLQFPLLLKFYAGQKFNFCLGPQFGFILSAKEKGYDYKYHFDPYNHTNIWGPEKEPYDNDVMDDFVSLDFGLAFGIGYDFPFGLNLGLRLNWGINNILDTFDFKQVTGSGISHRTFQLTVGYAPKLLN